MLAGLLSVRQVGLYREGRGKDGEKVEWGVTRKAVGRLSDDELEMIRARKLLSNATYKHICLINIL